MNKNQEPWSDIPKELLVKSIKNSSDKVKKELAKELYSSL